MSEEENTALTRRWFDEVWNKKKRELIVELVHKDAVVYGVGGDSQNGRAAFENFYDGVHTAFKNIEITLDEILAIGGKVFCRYTTRGKHIKTGADVCTSSSSLTRWKDGQITEAHNWVDRLDLLTQIGALPSETYDKEIG